MLSVYAFYHDTFRGVPLAVGWCDKNSSGLELSSRSGEARLGRNVDALGSGMNFHRGHRIVPRDSRDWIESISLSVFIPIYAEVGSSPFILGEVYRREIRSGRLGKNEMIPAQVRNATEIYDIPRGFINGELFDGTFFPIVICKDPIGMSNSSKVVRQEMQLNKSI